MRGLVNARSRLGLLEFEQGRNVERELRNSDQGHSEQKECSELSMKHFELAAKHWMTLAAAGCDGSLKNIGMFYRWNSVTKDQYEKALRAHQKAKEEMSSFERDMAEKCHKAETNRL